MATQSLDLVRADSSQWTLEISSATSLRQFSKAKALGVLPDEATYHIESSLQETPGIHFHDWNQDQMEKVVSFQSTRSGMACQAGPLFFDNGKALVEIALQGEDCADLRLVHFSSAVCDGFTLKKGVLRGVLDFQNDLGDFELRWEWTRQGKRQTAAFRFTVYSTKLNLHGDFRAMLDAVQDYFHWLRLDLLRQTQWGLASDSDPATLQSWLSIFRTSEPELRNAYHLLLQRYRQRLQSEAQYARADRIRRVPPRLEEEIARWNAERPNKLHRYENQVLDPDTLENRFVKAALLELLRDLRRAQTALNAQEKVSDAFKDWLSECEGNWRQLAAHPFWKSIGAFRGMRQESLVLLRDPVYSKILRYWKLLRQGLRFALLERFAGGMQSVDQLYEVWCLAQLHGILLESGFQEDQREWQLSAGEWNDLGETRESAKASFRFHSKDSQDVRLYLLYQPYTGKKSPGWEALDALPVPQNPDLVIRLEKDGRIHTWIFDAKYRVEADERSVPRWGAPAEAINQMHRYRDAILWTQDSLQQGKKEYRRETIGAFALFPGNEPGWETHPQHRSAYEVNIGAFQLHPSGQGREWLVKFLNEKLEVSAWDDATPLPKGAIPLEAIVLFAPSSSLCESLREASHPLFWVPWPEIRKISDRGNAIRNCTHLAIRKTGSATECVGSWLIRSKTKLAGPQLKERLAGLNPNASPISLDITQDYILLELGMEQNLDVRLLESMPEYGVMAWNRD